MKFTEEVENKIGRITPAGTITEFAIPTPNSEAISITTGADGNLWFTENFADKIASITPSGSITEYAAPRGSYPHDIKVATSG